MLSNFSARRLQTRALAVFLTGVTAMVPMARAAGLHTVGIATTVVLRPTAASSMPEGGADTSAAGFSAELLVQQVLLRNPGIDAMQAAADAAAARVESAGALDDPMVSYAVAPNTAGGPRQGLNQNVQISQRFPWPGTLDLRSRMARAEAESADQQVADLRLRLAARARADYAEWYYVHRALAINAEDSALVRRLRAAAEAAYASGQSPQQDVLQAEVELARLQNQAFELKRLRHTVQAKIDALQNLDPAAEVPAPGDLPMAIPLPALAALRDAALAHYPVLQSLAARVTASRERVDLAHKDSYPQVSVLAGYNSLMDLPAKRLTVGIAINIPFGGNHRAEVSAAHARLRESEATLDDARNQLLSDLEQTRATAAQVVETIQLYDRKLLPLTRLNLQAAEADYGNGTGDFLKLITAEQQHLMTRLELARARADVLIQLASLDYQTGGALWPSPVSATSRGVTP